MHSLMTNYKVNTGTYDINTVVTAIRMSNDIDGNPRYKVQVWVIRELEQRGTIWTPKVKGYRRSKDDTYILKSVYNLEEDLAHFMKIFEESVNEY